MEGGSGARSRRSRLGFFLGFGIEGFRGHLAAGLLEQNFHFALGLLQVFLAIARELHAFFEQLHGIVERQIRALQFADDLFQARERIFKIGLLRGFGLFCAMLDSRLSWFTVAGKERKSKSIAPISPRENRVED